MFSPFYYLSLVLILPSLGLASVIQIERNSRLQAPAAEKALPIVAYPSSLNLFNASAINAATMQVETSPGNSVYVRCDARLYGAGLNAQSCFSALHQSPTGDVQESWAYPHSPQPDVVLPIKLFSDDATCILQPVILSNAHGATARASAKNVTEAARAIILECVIRRRIGGTARQIGGDNKLGVTVALFKPQVTCAGTVSTPPSSCRYIIDEMFKTINEEFFGHATDPSITVSLPLTLQAPDGKCQVVIDTEGPTVRARWLDVWQAVEATVAVCIREGKGGKSKVASFSKHPMVGLYVSIMDEPASSTLIGVPTEIASVQGSLQSEVPGTFAELENPENLRRFLVKDSSPLMLPAQTVSVLAA